MILLSCRDLIRQFDRGPVFSNVTFDVKAGDRIGLVGPNGTGKSTLLRCLIGEDHPDSGVVETPNDVDIAMLEQRPKFDPGRSLIDEAKTGLQHLYDLQHEAEELANKMAEVTHPAELDTLGQRYDHLQEELTRKDAYNIDHLVDEVLHGLGFTDAEYERPLDTFSGGQLNRVLLARLLLRSPDVMFLDEPTNRLDVQSVEWLENFLTTGEKTFVLVSHDRLFLDRTVDRVIELHRSHVALYRGNYTRYREQREERHAIQLNAHERQLDEIARQKAFIAKNKAGQKTKQAQDREKKLAKLERIDRPDEFERLAMDFGEATRTGDLVLECKGLTKGFAEREDGQAAGDLFADLSLRIERGQRWGLVGPNGCGKTTLLKTLLGELPPDAGTFRIGANVEVGYYDQKLSSVSSETDCIEAVRPPKDMTMTPGHARAILAKFGIKDDLSLHKIGAMSGGERGKVALARLAALPCNVMVLDEPTNHLDLWAVEALEAALAKYDGTILFVSHDRAFLDALATHVLVWDDGVWREHEGNFSDYRAFRSRIETSQPTEPKSRRPDRPAASARQKSKPQTDRPKYPYRNIEDLEAEIAEVEGRLVELEAELIDPAILSNAGRIQDVRSEYDSRKRELADLEDRWVEAAG
ncbi:MAG: ABC-F family ATP-binding cassette domain-containing protein [Planctomycetota bacterium]